MGNDELQRVAKHLNASLIEVDEKEKVDVAELSERLDWIKERYEQAESDYLMADSQSVLNRNIKQVSSYARELRIALSALPDPIKDKFDIGCKKVRLSDGDESVDVAYGKSFVDSLRRELDEISRVADTLDVRIHTKRKPQFHKNVLLLDLRKCWCDFTKSVASKSRSNNRFIEFIDLVGMCNGMDMSGMSTRHFETK